MLDTLGTERWMQWSWGPDHPQQLPAGGQFFLENDTFKDKKAYLFGINGPEVAYQKGKLNSR